MQNHNHPQTNSHSKLVLFSDSLLVVYNKCNITIHPLNTDFSRLIPRPVYTLFSQQHWYIDSGATKYMTHRRDLITDFIKYKQPSKIFLGDNGVIKAYGEGKVKLQCHDGLDDVTLTLNKVWCVPEITKNLLRFLL